MLQTSLMHFPKSVLLEYAIMTALLEYIDVKNCLDYSSVRRGT